MKGIGPDGVLLTRSREFEIKFPCPAVDWPGFEFAVFDPGARPDLGIITGGEKFVGFKQFREPDGSLFDGYPGIP